MEIVKKQEEVGWLPLGADRSPSSLNLARKIRDHRALSNLFDYLEGERGRN